MKNLRAPQPLAIAGEVILYTGIVHIWTNIYVPYRLLKYHPVCVCRVALCACGVSDSLLILCTHSHALALSSNSWHMSLS